MNHAHTLRRIGYLQTAPACGDCAHSADQFTGLICRKFNVEVQDGGRCLHWSPDAHWLAANPEVAPLYDPPHGHLSPAEMAYARNAHVL